MKHIILSVLILSSALLASTRVNTISAAFSKGKVSANIKYYYIQTDKDNSYTNTKNTSAYANTVGGQLHFDSASLYGFRAGVTFMTTNPFLLGSSVDASIIGRDNGVRIEGNPSGTVARKGFSVLGEAYLAYDYQNTGVYIGREVIHTPLIDAKAVRLLPSAVEGASAHYTLAEKTKVIFSYYTGFKQRTSSVFTNIIEHALGDKTKAITGSDSGSLEMLSFTHQANAYSLKAYDYYAENFLNSVYLDGSYKLNLSDVKVAFSGQYINQKSIGNADTYFRNNPSVAGGKISVNAIGLKAATTIKSSKFILAYSKVLKENNKHDSLVLAWDGTPLYTNMITSNDLFSSNYGKSLGSDSIYIGNSQGIKFAYNQKYDNFGLKGFSTTLSYLDISNSRFNKDQNDYNIVLQYKAPKAFVLQLKGIWVQNNTAASADGTISQLKLLSQYRVIANYKF
ncbi:OprD family outer membrane porin [Sulfurimonas sp.]|uniref:OprD family outer membrane porin n=1 Tax=Sulfurimonas sp. TaxID=2022749 RepID=UPI002617C5C9|nr:OprD family outer membrane porin [Sulfurimonas sp.]